MKSNEILADGSYQADSIVNRFTTNSYAEGMSPTQAELKPSLTFRSQALPTLLGNIMISSKLVNVSMESPRSPIDFSVFGTSLARCCKNEGETFDDKADALSLGLSPFSAFGDAGGCGTSYLPQAASGSCFSRKLKVDFARTRNLHRSGKLLGAAGGVGQTSGTMVVCTDVGLRKDVLLPAAVAPWRCDPWAPC